MHGRAKEGARTKALVFAENWKDLNYTAHWLVLLMGDDAVAQHHGQFRSAALQAFRHDKKHAVRCPRCGHLEEITGKKKPRCSRTWLKVQYNDYELGNPVTGVTQGQWDANEKAPVPPGQLLVPEDRVEGLMLGHSCLTCFSSRVTSSVLDARSEMVSRGGWPPSGICSQDHRGMRRLVLCITPE